MSETELSELMRAPPAPIKSMLVAPEADRGGAQRVGMRRAVSVGSSKNASGTGPGPTQQMGVDSAAEVSIFSTPDRCMMCGVCFGVEPGGAQLLSCVGCDQSGLKLGILSKF